VGSPARHASKALRAGVPLPAPVEHYEKQQKLEVGSPARLASESVAGGSPSAGSKIKKVLNYSGKFQ